MAITSAFKQFQRNFSPSRSLSDIGFGVGGTEGLPGRMTSPLSAAPLQKQATGTGGGGSGMVPGATNIMMPLANLAPQTGQQQQVSPFAGTQFNFPVVQPAQTVGATYNITTGGDPFDWQAYLENLGLGDKGKGKCDTGYSKNAAGVCVKDDPTNTVDEKCDTGYSRNAAGVCVKDDTGTVDKAKGYTWDDAAFNRLFEAAGGTGLWGSFENWFRAPRGEQYKKTVSDHFESLKTKAAAVTQPVGGGRGGGEHREQPGERAAYAKAQSDAQKKVKEIKAATSNQNLAAKITKTATPTKPATPPFIPYTPPRKVVEKPKVSTVRPGWGKPPTSRFG